MHQHGSTWQAHWARWLILSLFVAFLFSGLTNDSRADEPSPAATSAQADDNSSFAWRIIVSLITFDSQGMLETLKKPEFTVAAIVALNIIVFVETGLLVGFFLPGDSLLVSAGLVCQIVPWNLPLLLTTLCLAAIIGDSVGYSIGYKTGPKIFNREKSLFFKKEHLLAAQRFYEKHGGKTIFLARFVPIIRTFAPVVAGVGRMNYRRFLAYNICGGIGWVVGMILIGFFLTRVIDPPFKTILGEQFEVQKHIEKVIVVVVLLSVSPGFFFWLKQKLKGKAAAGAAHEVSGGTTPIPHSAAATALAPGDSAAATAQPPLPSAAADALL